METTTHIVTSDKGHPEEIKVTGKRQRSSTVKLARDSDMNGCIDLYLQMAKEMRLKRRRNEEECVITGDLNNVRTMYKDGIPAPSCCSACHK